MRRVMVVLATVLLVSGCAPVATPDASSSPASPTASSASPTPTPTPTATAAPEPAATTEPAAAPAPATAAPQQPSTAGVDIDSAASLQVLVNKRRPLVPADYQPVLVPVSIAQDGDEAVRPEVDAALAQMSAAMQADIGEGIHVFSSYRGYARQTQLYNGYVAQYGQAQADTTSARPGHSEHQTGLSVDLMGTGGACRLDVCFGGTAAGRWIAEHAWEHGFIVRYPDGLQGITGYHFEPWHVRFVGAEVATAMHEQGIATFEEYAGTGNAPDYG
ncbi:D-alanyl-D-alanine carboxypeptidase [Agrococcus sp. UYP10]|uniref:M15 family metallopeptidase n=1 Tax=Agrococcus sp. UYP10 TaxID=1756355 RepID=UPI00339ADE2A